ncbi:DUF697 domain-containing protein, partial [Chamaesiphon sp. VAR_48_metabat_403]|uniref:slr1306 family protein n=1 Tax=Chamaesiphon sp. VAR_48_metabat_403 TaxID=2964700 RepID=UPI00286D7EBC
LTIESPDYPQIDRFKQQLILATNNLTRTERKIAITGWQKVGKSSLMQQLTTTPVVCSTPLKYIETPALFTVNGESNSAAIAESIALNADLVLFVTNGDLTATEYKHLNALHQANQRVMLVFDRADRYLPEERSQILHQLQSIVSGTLQAADVVDTSTAPTPIKVRKIQADGTSIDTLETPPVDISSLDRQLAHVLASESEKLVWCNTYRQIAGVRATAKTALNTVRRERALPLIEQNQWIVGAAAFANPVPALDLLATAAVNAQMVIDLGAIYQQKFSLEQAQAAAGAMGSVMLKLGLIEVCTQTVSGLLKTNAATFVAGGLVQGLSAAYLTRIAGLTLVEYLAAQDLVAPEPAHNWNLDLLGNTLQNVFQANQRVAYLQTVVRQGIDRLMPKSAAPEVG